MMQTQGPEPAQTQTQTQTEYLPETPVEPQVHEPAQAQERTDQPSNVPSNAPVQPQPHRLVDEFRSEPRRSALVWGAVLVMFGFIMLLGTVTGWSVVQLALLPALATVFLIAGIALRSPGAMIPAGILYGVGAGTILVDAFKDQLAGETSGGLFVTSLGAGFLLIPAFQAVFTRDTHWWPFIPGTILLCVGIALMIGGAALGVLDVLGRMWPLALIVLGVWIVWRAFRGKSDRPKDTSGGAPTA